VSFTPVELTLRTLFLSVEYIMALLTHVSKPNYSEWIKGFPLIRA